MNFITGSPYSRLHRSPLATGCRFAVLCLLCWLLSACNTADSPSALLKDLASGASIAAPTESVPPTDLPSPVPTRPASRNPLSTPPGELNPRPSLVLPTSGATIASTDPTPTKTRQPRIASDLLYLSEGRLMRWDRVTRFSSTLVENVDSYTTDASGMRIILLRPRQVALNGQELFDLDLLDLSSKQVVHLVEETGRIYTPSLSPDGNRLAYRTSPDEGAVQVISVGAAVLPLELGTCIPAAESDCSVLAWSPDSQHLLWSDARGIWTGKPPAEPARQIHANQVEVADPAGQSSQIQARFSGLQWSPLGRFALLTVSPDHSEVSWRAVLDTRTGRLQHLIDSYETDPKQASVEWLQDGTLAVARATDPQSGRSPVIQIWNVLPTNPNLVVELRKFEPFSQSDSGSQLQPSDRDQEILCLDWIYQPRPDNLQFGAILEGAFKRPALFDLKMSTGSLTQLAQLDPETEQVIWAPDGSGLLVIGTRGQVFYSSLDGREVYDLRQQLGANPHQFLWLPPAPRG